MNRTRALGVVAGRQEDDVERVGALELWNVTELSLGEIDTAWPQLGCYALRNTHVPHCIEASQASQAANNAHMQKATTCRMQQHSSLLFFTLQLAAGQTRRVLAGLSPHKARAPSNELRVARWCAHSHGSLRSPFAACRSPRPTTIPAPAPRTAAASSARSATASGR